MNPFASPSARLYTGLAFVGALIVAAAALTFNLSQTAASHIQSDPAKAAAVPPATVVQSLNDQRNAVVALLVVALAGACATSLWFAASFRRRLKTVSELAEKVAQGDLNVELSSESNDEVGRLVANLGVMVGNLRKLVGDVRTTADSIGTASAEIASGNQDLSRRTEQTASSLQSTASSIAQLTTTVKQSADAASQANQLATSAAAVAQRGGQVVSQVVSTMDEINASSRKISDIIGTIDGIAFQTNILALNAAVEAARAGEQGRGFAVVAGEVRSLAQRSAEAAREIKALIGASVDRVETGARLVQDAGGTMNEIVASVQRVSDIIAEISAAAAEQSSGIGQVNEAVTQLDQMTQQNAALVEQSAAAAESLKQQASKITDVVAAFRGGQGEAAKRSDSAPRLAAKTIASARDAARQSKPAPAAAKAAPKAVAPAPAAAAAPAAPTTTAPARSAPATADVDGEWETF